MTNPMSASWVGWDSYSDKDLDAVPGDLVMCCCGKDTCLYHNEPFIVVRVIKGKYKSAFDGYTLQGRDGNIDSGTLMRVISRCADALG